MILQTILKVFAILPFVFEAGLEMCQSAYDFWSGIGVWGYKLGANALFAKSMNLQTVVKAFAVLPFVFQAGLEM